MTEWIALESAIASSSITSGTRLGAYEILGPIGAGGMGEVYRARDTRLERSVAIKVLPAEFAADPALKLRFEREARTISALSHPHICTLFDVGSTGDRSYLVMEYLEGESLADRLSKGPLPIDQVLRMGAEIASALESAHRQGITHRDIKPGNIMLTRSGAKLLDFGLAKGHTSPIVAQGSGGGTTELKPITEQGTIVGTFQYMAPEQLEGREADPRTDIFALGAVLYEAATGQRAFEGKSRASLIASILDRDPPPISSVRPLAPLSLDRVIRACLRKDPLERIQTAHDLALDLSWIRESSSTGEAAVTRRSRRRWAMPAVVAFLAITAIVFALLYAASRSTAREPEVFAILPVTGSSLAESVAVAPNGKSVAFVASNGNDMMLWIREFADPQPRVVPGTEEARWPVWSADGEWIAFFALEKLKRVNVATGTVQNIAAADYGVGAAWGPDGTILFAKHFNDGLFRVRASGGEVERVTTLDASRKESLHGWPQFLSDGKRFLFLNRTVADERNQIAAASLEGGKPKLLMRADSLAGYRDGRIFFVRENVLYSQELDEDAIALRGDPVEVARNVAYSESWASSPVSVSRSGVIAYQPAIVANADLGVYDRKGALVRKILTEPGIYGASMSPDGSRVVLGIWDARKGAGDIWVVDPARNVRTRLTGGLAHHESAAWAPDGERVLFSSDRAGMFDIYVQNVDDGSPPVVVWQSDRDKEESVWTPDGQSIVTTLDDPVSGGYNLYAVSLQGEAKPVLATDADERQPAVSPDGRMIAFTSHRGGARQVFVMPFEGGRITQISSEGGDVPDWSADGSELFYVGSGRKLMAVSMKPAPGIPQPLFELPETYGGFTVTPDGHFLIAALNRGTSPPPHINIIR